MFLSAFEMFKVGIGPSSSHTMGPMVAAGRFLESLRPLPIKARGASIIVLSPAMSLSHSMGEADRDRFIGSEHAEKLSHSLFGRVDDETLAHVIHSNGAMVEYRRGRRAIFNAGSCEWVAGLIRRDPAVECVTRNVLLGDCG